MRPTPLLLSALSFAFATAIAIGVVTAISPVRASDDPTTTALDHPEAVIVAGSGAVYIADTGNCVVRKVEGSAMDTIAGTGTCGNTGDAGPATSATLDHPAGLALDAAGNLYIADTMNCRVRRVLASNGTIEAFAGSGVCGYNSSDNFASNGAINAKLNHPRGLVFNTTTGDLYIADTDNCAVRGIASGADRFIYNEVGSGTCGSSSLDHPRDVDFSGSGGATLYVADTGNCMIRKFGPGPGTDVGTADACNASGDNLNSPSGVIVALDGLYIADTNNCRIVLADDGDVTPYGSTTGLCTNNGDGSGVAGFNLPGGVAISSGGSVYVADTGNCRIRRVVSGTWQNFAGLSSGCPAPPTNTPTPSPTPSPTPGTSGPGTWTTSGYLNGARDSHTATLVRSGKVLVAGGYAGFSLTNSAELYDPNTRLWSSAAGMSVAREGAAAVLLQNGKVLVAGGADFFGNYLAGAELYDPASNAWSAGGTMSTGRYAHTATLLTNGKVLVVSGSTAELYDPVTNSWSPAIKPSGAHNDHSATRLADGRVLVVDGVSELYDPSTNSWASAGSGSAGYNHTAALLSNGNVLVSGGVGIGGPVATAKIYNPTSNGWTAAPNMLHPRTGHNVTLLGNGLVLIDGGVTLTGYDAAAELYNPAQNNWSDAGSTYAHQYSTSTLLHNGEVLIVGGFATFGSLNSASTFDPTDVFAAGSLTAGRTGQTSTLLPNGSPLVADGSVLAVGGIGAPTSANLYSAATGSWFAAPSLSVGRSRHTATLLPNRKVLVAGGSDGAGASINSVELYDLDTNAWSTGASMSAARASHSATLLGNGKVLVAGGEAGGSQLLSAELYDPATNTWSPAGNMTTARAYHAATPLNPALVGSPKILVTGGVNGTTSIASSEIYNPATNTWSAGAAMPAARSKHTAVLLSAGKVIVIGGVSAAGSALATTSLYAPATNSWTSAAAMQTARHSQTASLLPNGKVVVVGGIGTTPLSSMEIYNPGSNSWMSAEGLAAARSGHTMSALANGKLLVAGGSGLATAELIDPGFMLDSDGDGYNDGLETELGPSMLSYCGTMRADVITDGIINSGDSAKLASVLGHFTPPAPHRMDQGPAPDGMLNSIDQATLAAFYGQSVLGCP